MSENYIPLYRKYRPQTLDMLVGQEHIKKTLTSAIELGKISHAYLFTGPRGTGKTSTARILAKSLNCVNGPTVHPCGVCESCKDIANSIPIDVIEIDAASNRKVEDAQNILEKVQYVPVNGKYKIYIIDEVHMLTNHAFNALLKTLEEPPENVIFILATTEVHKVLDTIKSRCQRFDFRRITTDDIVKHLRYIADNEKIKITDDALFVIAKNSAGGMRDSISLLDQLSILGASKEITVDDVNSILGRISFDTLCQITDKIISSNPSDAIALLNEVYNSGNEPLQILTNLNEYFKNLLIARTCSEKLLPELTGLNEPQIKEIKKQSEKLEAQQIVFLIECISYYIKEIKSASNQHLWLEVGIIDLANMSENTTLMDLQKRVSALELGNPVTERVEFKAVTKPAPIPVEQNDSLSRTISKNKSDKKIQEEEQFTPPPMSKKADVNDMGALWNSLLSNISSTPTQAMLRQLATPLQISEDGVIITLKNEGFVSQLNDLGKKQLIADAVKIVFNKEVPLTIRLASASDGNLNKTGDNNSVEEEKKNPIKSEIQKEHAIEKPAEVKERSGDSKITETQSKSDTDFENAADNTEKQRIESDQEKLILDLFDGKYVD